MRDGLSASDVALLSGNNGRNGDGFGADGYGIWIIVFLIFAVFGWGGNGFGGNRGNGSNGSGVLDNYVLASDFATLQRQLSDNFTNLTSQSRYIQNGLCDGFYAMNTGMLNGFSSINQNIMTSGYETRNAVNTLGYNLQDCCCKTNYNMAMNTNAIQQSLCTGFRDIIDSQNANYRALHDEIVANRIEDKNAQILAQQNEINALRLSASQERQNAYLLSELKPCPSAAYIVPNPNCCYNYTVNGYGYGTGTGCCGCNI